MTDGVVFVEPARLRSPASVSPNSTHLWQRGASRDDVARTARGWRSLRPAFDRRGSRMMVSSSNRASNDGGETQSDNSGLLAIPACLPNPRCPSDNIAQRPTLYRRIAARRFPPPTHLGGRACGWAATALRSWIEDPEGYRAPPTASAAVARRRGCSEQIHLLKWTHAARGCSVSTFN